MSLSSILVTALAYTISFTVLAGPAPAAAEVLPVNTADSPFQGAQEGVGSWFRAAAGQDSTNGQSWCGYSYTDQDPLFAPSLKRMGGATWASDPQKWREQTQKNCGLEAKVTDPKTGKSMLMYIGDAFDDQWVRSPGSIDIMIDAFTTIHGSPNGNKDDVIQSVQWELTGNVNTKYAAPGAHWGSA